MAECEKKVRKIAEVILDQGKVEYSIKSGPVHPPLSRDRSLDSFYVGSLSFTLMGHNGCTERVLDIWGVCFQHPDIVEYYIVSGPELHHARSVGTLSNLLWTMGRVPFPDVSDLPYVFRYLIDRGTLTFKMDVYPT